MTTASIPQSTNSSSSPVTEKMERGFLVKVYDLAISILLYIPNHIIDKAKYTSICFHHYRQEEKRHLLTAIIFTISEVFMSIFRGKKELSNISSSTPPTTSFAPPPPPPMPKDLRLPQKNTASSSSTKSSTTPPNPAKALQAELEAALAKRAAAMHPYIS